MITIIICIINGKLKTYSDQWKFLQHLTRRVCKQDEGLINAFSKGYPSRGISVVSKRLRLSPAMGEDATAPGGAISYGCGMVCLKLGRLTKTP